MTLSSFPALLISFLTVPISLVAFAFNERLWNGLLSFQFQTEFRARLDKKEQQEYCILSRVKERDREV